MYPPPEIRTSNAELLGTTAGIIVTVIVATAGLAVMLGMVYWAAAHPGYKRPAQQPRPQQAPPDSVSTGNQRIAVRLTTEDQPGAPGNNAVRAGEPGMADGAAQPAVPEGVHRTARHP